MTVTLLNSSSGIVSYRIIEHLMTDKGYSCKLGDNGHAWVYERWSFDRAIDRLEKRFAEAIGERRRAVSTCP